MKNGAREFVAQAHALILAGTCGFLPRSKKKPQVSGKKPRVRRLGLLAVEVDQAVAVVESQGEQTENRQAEKARDFGPEVAALRPHVHGSHGGIPLAESSELKKQIAGLIKICHLAVEALETHAVIAADVADFGGHVVGKERAIGSGIEDKQDLARITDARGDQQQMTKPVHGREMLQCGRRDAVVEFAVAGTVTRKRIQAQLSAREIQRHQELGEDIRSD